MASDPYTPIDDSYAGTTTPDFVSTEYYPGEPKERIEEEQKEAAVVAASYPVMAAVADWFEDQVQEAMDITNINLESSVPVAAQVKAFQLYQIKMIEKAREFQNYMSERV